MTQRGTLGWRGEVAVRLGGPGLRALASTWRFRFRNREALLGLRKVNQPFIFSLWHGHLLPLVWLHRGEGIRVLISEHRDGEMIARLAHSLGLRTVRGSSSRGGERALLALARALQEGEEVAVTPDGPRGPARKCQPGALIAASRARSPILPIAAHAESAWRLNSWDRFLIPKPFARVSVSYGDPLYVVTGSAREAASHAERLERVMLENEARAAAG